MLTEWHHATDTCGPSTTSVKHLVVFVGYYCFLSTAASSLTRMLPDRTTNGPSVPATTAGGRSDTHRQMPRHRPPNADVVPPLYPLSSSSSSSSSSPTATSFSLSSLQQLPRPRSPVSWSSPNSVARQEIKGGGMAPTPPPPIYAIVFTGRGLLHLKCVVHQFFTRTGHLRGPYRFHHRFPLVRHVKNPMSRRLWSTFRHHLGRAQRGWSAPCLAWAPGEELSPIAPAWIALASVRVKHLFSRMVLSRAPWENTHQEGALQSPGHGCAVRSGDSLA
ncbi:hypothetical protein PR202_ga13807 [Eleusine coracana subsp. coracana]|uniref:Uncharacterized protein n=1 Tax=Eleusine coracana subsp. coracana TaxID=191504 RepID=A0AAV5CFE2_ELECO|nr:hypothetical protein PR202_ga13807 [Eleusine coracana subsp. coracana]